MPATQQKAPAPLQRAAPDQRTATLGSWRLVRLLGEGQWSQVYQASPLDATETSSADYAVKLLKPACASDPVAITQLQHEANVGKSLAHPHVECVLSAHVDRPPHYLVIPFQPGATLRDHLHKSRRLSVAGALWIARQVSEGLFALQERNWMHSDVKPENVYIATSGHATLCDLGLCRTLNRSSDLQPMIAGTPAYMPPEEFRGLGDLSPARDTYSLGVMLFEMLTGRLPFPQTDAAELAAAHRLLTPPDPRSLQLDIPAPVVRVVRRMLAKEPLRRPCGQELTKWLVDLEIDSFDIRPAG